VAAGRTETNRVVDDLTGLSRGERDRWDVWESYYQPRFDSQLVRTVSIDSVITHCSVEVLGTVLYGFVIDHLCA